MFWFDLCDFYRQNLYFYAGHWFVLGMGPDEITDRGYEPTDLYVFHGPQLSVES